MSVEMLKSNSHGYSEVGQSSDVKFATVGINDKGLYQIHPFFKCKDFFNEYVTSARTKKPYSIYGFSYDSMEHPAPEDTYILMQSSKIASIMKGITKYLNPVEEEADMVLTTYEDIGENRILVHADRLYSSDPLFISVYTLLLRNFYYADEDYVKDTKDLNEYNEALAATLGIGNLVGRVKENAPVSLFKTLILNMRKMAVKSDDEFQERIANITVENLHNSTGILAFSKYVLKNTFEKWKKDNGDAHYLEKTFKQLHPNREELLAIFQGEGQ